MENSGSEARIGSLLTTLKSDLQAMRVQDVKLMKQLIGISETIQSLTKSRGTCANSPRFMRHRHSLSAVRVISASSFNKISTPLVRQQSAPTCDKLFRRDSSGSSSSIDDMYSSFEDINEEPCSETDESINTSTRSLPTACTMSKSRSFSFMTPLPDEDDSDDSKYEGILMTNIKLWKHAQFEKTNKSQLGQTQFVPEEITEE